MFTLSAMTAGIRRNWIEVLRKSIRPNGSPDLTQSVPTRKHCVYIETLLLVLLKWPSVEEFVRTTSQSCHAGLQPNINTLLLCVFFPRLPDCSADKDNTRHASSRRHRSQSEASSSANPTHCKFDYVELSRVVPPSAATSANQRESGEGQVREHGQCQEERSRDAAHSQWEAVLSRKGAGHLTEQRRLEEEIEKKWAEFEHLPLKEMRSLPPMGSRPGPLSNQALEREVVRE